MVAAVSTSPACVCVGVCSSRTMLHEWILMNVCRFLCVCNVCVCVGVIDGSLRHIYVDLVVLTSTECVSVDTVASPWSPSCSPSSHLVKLQGGSGGFDVEEVEFFGDVGHSTTDN